jgi:hypothetical protein
MHLDYIEPTVFFQTGLGRMGRLQGAGHETTRRPVGSNGGGLAHVGVLGTAFDRIHHVADGEVMNGSSGF